MDPSFNENRINVALRSLRVRNEILATCENPMARDRSEISLGPTGRQVEGSGGERVNKAGKKSVRRRHRCCHSVGPQIVASPLEKMIAIAAAVLFPIWESAGRAGFFISADGIFHSESSRKSCLARWLSFPPSPLPGPHQQIRLGGGPSLPRSHDSVCMATLQT